MARISTILIEQCALSREGLAALLLDTAYRVCARLESTDQLARVHLPSERSPLIVLGLTSNVGESVEAIRRRGRPFAESKILVISEFDNDLDVQDVLRRGADACIVHVSSREVLVKCLDLIVLGQKVIVMSPMESRCVSQTTLNITPISRVNDSQQASAGGRLSKREKIILGYLAKGEPNKIIARRCGIAEATVKAHLKSIHYKIDVKNRTQAAIWAMANLLNTKPLLQQSSAPREFKCIIPDVSDVLTLPPPLNPG